jgi:ribosome-associated translation inhibitor RaiA
MSFRIHFKGLSHEDDVKSECERHADELRGEFPETSKVEVTVTLDGNDHDTHVRVTGKDTEIAASASDRELRTSIVDAFEKARRQLRKQHDKAIFTRRRGARQV